MDSLIPSLDGFAREGLWYTQIFVVVFLTLILSFVQKRLTRRLYTRFSQTDLVWDDALVDALRRPLSMLIWLIGISFTFYIIGKRANATIFEAVLPIRDVGIISLLAWFLLRLVNNIRENFVVKGRERGRQVDVTTADAVSKLLRASIIITSTLIVLQTLGFSISGVLAFGGIGGVAVGFASKDLLANFFGGLMIYMDRPFEVGDWVRSPDRDIEGTVEHIGWRLTRIRTFDKRPLYIPNATFTSIAVENPSRMSNRRIYETIGIRYADASRMRSILDAIKQMLLAHSEIDSTQTLMVNFNSFAESSLDFFVYCFTKTTKWERFHEVKEDVLLQIHGIIQRHGAEVAFPTSTVMLEPSEARDESADEQNP